MFSLVGKKSRIQTHGYILKKDARGGYCYVLAG